MTAVRTNRGFSILEVLITASIIGIMTAVIVVRYGSFNNVVLLKSQAYELALDLREAQSRAVSVRGEGTVYRQDYGIYFDVTAPAQYQPFLDSTNMVEYGVNAAYFDEGEELGPPIRLDSRFEIFRICVNGCSEEVDDLSISFKRPDFDGQFSSRDARDMGLGLVSDAHVILKNAVGPIATRTVRVLSTGQIQVE